MCDNESASMSASSDFKIEATELYQRNFEQFSRQKDCIRSLIFSLLRHDNDVKRINTEISNLLDRLKSETGKLKKEVRKLRGEDVSSISSSENTSVSAPSFASSNQEISEITMGDCNEVECHEFLIDEECVETEDLTSNDSAELRNKQIAEKCCMITTLCERYGKVAKKLKLSRQEILKLVREEAKQFSKAKSSFLTWQEKAVENVKRATVCVPNEKKFSDSAKHIRELQDLFCNEIKYVKCCEEQLKKLFFLVEGDDRCLTGRSDTSSTTADDSTMEMYWPPRDNFANAFEENIECFKKTVGKALVKAYAAMHLYQPEDPASFLAQYLMHLQIIEEKEQEKEKEREKEKECD